MNILIFGASGFLGGHIVQALHGTGHRLTVGIRDMRRMDLDPATTRILAGDLADPEYIREAVAGQDAIFFAAGRTWSPGIDSAEYRRSNVTITRQFFQVIRGLRGVRILFTSSLSTIGGTSCPIVLTERSGRAAVCQARLNPYDLAKIECEQIALGAAAEGHDVVLLNPGLMIGPGATARGGLAPPFIALWVLLGQCPFFVDARITFCDVRDVALGHVAALDRGRAGEGYILGGPTLKRSEFYIELGKWTGTRCPRAVPGAWLTAIACATDGLQWLSRSKFRSPIQRAFARSQNLHYCGDSKKASEELGYTIRPLGDSIRDMVRHDLELQRLPEEFNFVHQIDPENARGMLLLRQLVHSSGYAHWLQPRLAGLYTACQTSAALREALRRLLAASRYDRRHARFRWSRSCTADAKSLQQFLAHVYYASREFLQEVQ